jgi:hypothetical protein
MNEHHHRLFRTRGRIDCEDIQRETVFVPQQHAAEVDLRALIAEFRGAAHALPACRRHRRTPTQIAHGRRGEGNPAEGAVAPFNRTLKLTVLGTDDGRGAHAAGRLGARRCPRYLRRMRRGPQIESPGTRARPTDTGMMSLQAPVSSGGLRWSRK